MHWRPWPTRALSRTEGASALASTSTGGIVAVDGYSPAIDDLLVLSRASFDPGDSVDDAPAAATDFLAEAQEAAARERDLITSLAADQALVPEQFQDVTALASGQGILAEQAAAVATPALQVRIDRINDGLAAASTGRDALFFSTVEADDLTAWLAGADARVDELRSLRDDAATLAVAAVDDLAGSARRVLILSALAVVATVLISALLVRSATRSIARPLQELATQAEEVALSRLPDAVRAQQSEDTDVHLPALRATGASEVREVAAAFNDVQETALRLAGEQAVLRRNLGDALTNLGRRNQALLGRQLDFISSLEKRETDPAFLDHLFKLDHLASRMRRNAESLLILAGSETPRRRRKPAEVAEIVRAAMSEVEDFERVRLGHLGRSTLGGPVVIDLVHLLAELIENALGFSPPDTTVEIDGRSLGQGGYQLAVIDHGVGMSDVELVAANHRLAGLDEVDGMPTRYLGQYVIAKLAAKIGALVRLQPSTGGRGVTAVVSLPATAVMGATDRSNIAQPLPGSRAAREQGPVPFAPGAGIAAGSAQPEPVIDPDADPFAEPVPTIAEMEPTAWGNVPGTFEDAAPPDEFPALPAAAVAALDTSGLEGTDPTSLWPSPSAEVPVPEPVLPVPAVTEPWAAPDPAFSDPIEADAVGAEPVATDSWTLPDPATDALPDDPRPMRRSMMRWSTTGWRPMRWSTTRWSTMCWPTMGWRPMCWPRTGWRPMCWPTTGCDECWPTDALGDRLSRSMTTGTAPVGGTTSRRRHRSSPWCPIPGVGPTRGSLRRSMGTSPPVPPRPRPRWTGAPRLPLPVPRSSNRHGPSRCRSGRPRWRSLPLRLRRSPGRRPSRTRQSPHRRGPRSRRTRPRRCPAPRRTRCSHPWPPGRPRPSRRSSPTSPLRPPTAPAWAEAWVVA